VWADKLEQVNTSTRTHTHTQDNMRAPVFMSCVQPPSVLHTWSTGLTFEDIFLKKIKFFYILRNPCCIRGVQDGGC